jgi:8-oxo-dGTP pyrophosphatase MutT (NUDIX family)
MKPKRAAPKPAPVVQYGVLPYREGEHGLEVLLITSRESRRWVAPKGWPMKGRKPHAAAAREALEEAGITGKVEKQPFGTYRYAKAFGAGAGVGVGVWIEVEVFPLEVERERAAWPEMAERARRWFPIEEAARQVHEPELAELIRDFALAHTGARDGSEATSSR